MRNAVTALLAVPIIAAIYAGALLRRSVVSRLVLGLGLCAVLGAGVIGAGLPSVTTATPTTLDRPADPRRVPDGGRDGRERDHPGRDRVHHPDERALGRGRGHGRAADAGRPGLGRNGPDPDDLAEDRLGARVPSIRSRSRPVPWRRAGNRSPGPPVPPS